MVTKQPPEMKNENPSETYYSFTITLSNKLHVLTFIAFKIFIRVTLN